MTQRLGVEARTAERQGVSERVRLASHDDTAVWIGLWFLPEAMTERHGGESRPP